MATRRSSRIRSGTPNASIAVNSGSEDSQDANMPIPKEKPKPAAGPRITSYFSPKQRAAAAASATADSDNSNVSQK